MSFIAFYFILAAAICVVTWVGFFFYAIVHVELDEGSSSLDLLEGVSDFYDDRWGTYNDAWGRIGGTTFLISLLWLPALVLGVVSVCIFGVGVGLRKLKRK